MGDNLDSLASNTIGQNSVTEERLRHEVKALGERWSIDGVELKLELRGQPMAKCGAAAAQATSLADEMDHHPRIVLEPSGLTLTIRTADKNAITLTDLIYAARFERWLRSNGW